MPAFLFDGSFDDDPVPRATAAFGDDFAVPTFDDIEPDDGERWSTWTAITPSERGPKPWPDWVVTSASAIDTELGIVKSGKEADVYLIERAIPGAPDTGTSEAIGQRVLLAAKRYRSSDHSDFHRSSMYRESRTMRRTRDTRAIARGSAYGRQVAAGAWSNAEFEALCAMYERGVAVPYPVQVNGTEILMEFIGDGMTAAPRLAQSRASGAELAGLYEQVIEIMHGFARAGSAHGDLSPYNLLEHHGRVIAIDLPQLVDIVGNPNGMGLLERDCHNISEWFARRGLVRDEGELLSEVLASAY